MSHEIHASIRLVLPEDGKEASAALAKATAEWAKLVHALEGAVVTFSVGEAHPVPVVRRRRGRPRRNGGDALAAAEAFERAASMPGVPTV